ncbi:hypothetical protein KBK19_11835 [Microvirga sp. STR05]|uniref:Transposase n=1 Tax=Hymenobacter duratus TaxID=2771356 RepID=A0ABR8JJC6_9BACT|nr:hypothetical protein [Hymenobacter duratus]MBD2715726.1 hypothetical protein [Hymenobacter duratus]MBR7950637.1 hypothetical protein [Microvirga sp. STR05]
MAVTKGKKKGNNYFEKQARYLAGNSVLLPDNAPASSPAAASFQDGAKQLYANSPHHILSIMPQTTALSIWAAFLSEWCPK